MARDYGDDIGLRNGVDDLTSMMRHANVVRKLEELVIKRTAYVIHQIFWDRYMDSGSSQHITDYLMDKLGSWLWRASNPNITVFASLTNDRDAGPLIMQAIQLGIYDAEVRITRELNHYLRRYRVRIGWIRGISVVERF